MGRKQDSFCSIALVAASAAPGQHENQRVATFRSGMFTQEPKVRQSFNLRLLPMQSSRLKMIAQRMSAVVTSKHIETLQFRYDAVDELCKGIGQKRR